MDKYLNDLCEKYGLGAGISIDRFQSRSGREDYRFRHRQFYGTLGVWVSEHKATKILEERRIILIRSNKERWMMHSEKKGF